MEIVNNTLFVLETSVMYRDQLLIEIWWKLIWYVHFLYCENRLEPPPETTQAPPQLNQNSIIITTKCLLNIYHLEHISPKWYSQKHGSRVFMRTPWQHLGSTKPYMLISISSWGYCYFYAKPALSNNPPTDCTLTRTTLKLPWQNCLRFMIWKF